MLKFPTAAYCLLAATSITCAQPSFGSLGQGTGSQSELNDRQSAPDTSEIFGAAIDLLIEKVRATFNSDAQSGSRWSSNASPRDTVFTFLESMNLSLYKGEDVDSQIRKTLPEGFHVQGPEVIALKSVFDRLGTLHPSDFPSKNSAITEHIESYEVFPYAIDHEWVWRWLDAPPNGTITLEKLDDAKWRFTEKTMRGAPALLESMQSIPPVYANTGSDIARNVFLPSFDETPWWGWIIAAVGLLGAFFTGRSSRRLMIRFGDRYEAQTKPLIGAFYRSISTSMSIILGTLLFVFASTFIELSPAISQIYWKCIQVVLLVALVWVIFGFTDLISTLVRSHVVTENREYGEMTVTIIQRIVRTFFFIMITVFVLENVFGFSVGTLITGIGILGLALSLAGKETAQNLFGAISIFVNRPFVVGDWVEFQGELGEVVDVRMQATHIRLLSGEMLIVPNMQFISKQVENLAMRKYIRREMDIAIPYATEPDKIDQAVELIDDVLRSDEVVSEGKCNVENRPPIISFSDYGDYYLNLKVYYWYFIGDDGEELQRSSERGWFSYLRHCTLVNQAILRAFNKEKIKFAFPTQTLALGKAEEGTI
jgi:MscS family membrane protein